MARLVLVPTPIGNLGDLTARAAEVLKSAETVAAEDTRRSRQLLNHLGLDRPLVRLDAHTIPARAPALLREAGTLAFITDAGTPGISDPGAELVRLALELGLEIEALPGPTAFVPALILSGLDASRFTFEGFLPRKGRHRRERLQGIAASPATSIMYESPKRLAATLSDLGQSCGGERPAAVSREISKRFEETVRGSLKELTEQFTGTEVRGECVITVAGTDEPQDAAAAAGARLGDLAVLLADAGLEGRQLREALLLAGASRNAAYELSLTRGT